MYVCEDLNEPVSTMLLTPVLTSGVVWRKRSSMSVLCHSFQHALLAATL